VARASSAVLLAVLCAALLLPATARTGFPGSSASAASAAAPQTLKRVWIGGDSMAYQIQATLTSRVHKLGVPKVTSLCKSSSGLVRPDFFNWPVRLRSAMAGFHPQAVVFMVGTNDGQGMRVGGATYAFGTTAWKKEYTKRVKRMMDAMRSGGATHVYWVGMPIMRSAEFGRRMAILNAIFRSQAGAHQGVTYLDAWKLFSSSRGAYVGAWRSADGMHFNMAGVSRLADAVVALVRRGWF
jgi:uncharacterized protein